MFEAEFANLPDPKNFKEAEVLALLDRQGYTRVRRVERGLLEVVQDRLRAGSADPARLGEAIEAALRGGRGRLLVHALATTPTSTSATAPATSSR